MQIFELRTRCKEEISLLTMLHDSYEYVCDASSLCVTMDRLLINLCHFSHILSSNMNTMSLYFRGLLHFGKMLSYLSLSTMLAVTTYYFITKNIIYI